MPKQILFALSLTVIVLTSVVVILVNNSDDKPSKIETETAINQAGLIYRQKVQSGQDLSTGPCLSDALMPGWVVDIVHSPRTSVDDLPHNQCPAFLEGRAKHFVELDLEGRLIRVR